MKAYCWMNGVIGLGRAVPAGALLIASAKPQKLRRAVRGNARMAYDNETLLVPGIPEANSIPARLVALSQFQENVKRMLA